MKDSEGESMAPKAESGVVKGRLGGRDLGVSANNKGDLRFSKEWCQE